MIDEAGFCLTEAVLSPNECDRLSEKLLTGLSTRGRAGARHLMANPDIAALAFDDRLMEIARKSLGAQAVPYRATLFEKSGRANWLVVWHQDTALPLAARVTSDEWGPWATKAGVCYAHAPTWALQRILALRLHLDASTPQNGGLRVIPESHRLGVLTDDAVFERARQQPAVACLVGRGGVLAMRPLLIHSSSKAVVDLPRRVIHIEYAETLNLGQGVRLAIT
ncbi:MAG: phytanoyl-CoA dioxygenase family protein [Acidobacteria bacterium]|nr:phytanoyl-CoA dioxygenase family protein [Acidobacteriota bacterium]